MLTFIQSSQETVTWIPVASTLSWECIRKFFILWVNLFNRPFINVELLSVGNKIIVSVYCSWKEDKKMLFVHCRNWPILTRCIQCLDFLQQVFLKMRTFSIRLKTKCVFLDENRNVSWEDSRFYYAGLLTAIQRTIIDSTSRRAPHRMPP